MKKGSKLSTSEKVFLIVVLLLLVGASWNTYSPVSFRKFFGLPLATFIEIPQPEPAKPNECNQLGGICLAIEVGCPKGYFEYGSCKTEPIQICCIEDKCRTSGGYWVFDTITYSGRELPTFRERCVCPIPKVYDSLKGCSKVYQ